MGFFGDLTGSSQRKDIQNANTAATGHLKQGYDGAQGNINTGYAGANANYGHARTDLGLGWDAAKRQAGKYLDMSTGYLDPYSQSGQSGQKLYADALGVNGQPVQRQVAQQFAGNDPFRQQNADFATNALMRQFNAQGMGQSGTAALAASRANLERGSQDWNAWLSRLQGLGAQGMQAAGQQASMTANTGGQLAGYGMQFGQNLAGVSGQKAALDYQRGGDLANLDWGYNSALAGNDINYGNAISASRTQGVNNLLSGLGTLGGMAISAFAPGPVGATAAGNIGKAISGGVNNLTGYFGGGGAAPSSGFSFNNAQLYPGMSF